jgi:hypothetical protein
MKCKSCVIRKTTDFDDRDAIRVGMQLM